MTAAPLRFLGLVLGGWVFVRAAMLAPEWLAEEQPEPGPLAKLAGIKAPAKPKAVLLPTVMLAPPALAVARAKGDEGPPAAVVHSDQPRSPIVHAQLVAAPSHGFAILPPARAPARPTLVLPAQSRFGRWSASAWAFVRGGDASPLAAAGTLGGSQFGARIGYRLNGDPTRPIAVQARLYSPARRPEAAEAGLGVEWKPLADLPVRLLAERRQALGSEGRSAFGLSAYGGVSGVKALGPLTLDAYGQAGVVGTRSRDLFADGSVSIGLPMEAVRVAGGAWGGAQPGVARLDVGPQLSVRLPGPAHGVRLIADWRFRIVGDARPGSGPALTLATDF
jgi:hypothetical protein